MEDLNPALSDWLAAPAHLIPELPRQFEALFQEAVAPRRWTSLRVGTGLGLLAFLSLSVPLWFLELRAHPFSAEIWFGLGFPCAITCHSLTWTKLPLPLQEVQVALFHAGAAVAAGIIGVTSPTTIGTVLADAAMLLIMTPLASGNLSFRTAIGYIAFIVTGFSWCIQARPDQAGLPGGMASGIVLFSSICTIYAFWRVELETRRTWALMFRERCKQEVLTLHNEELVELSQRDPLTGLANRRAFELAEHARWRDALTTGEPVGLVVLDVDHFKIYNDFYGHPAGDACLRKVARCLGEQLRGKGDVVARIGGEEFAILLPDLELEAAGDIAERVRQAVAQLELPHLGCGRGQIVTISAGACSLVPRPGATAAELFAAADSALYAAKQSGRNRVCLADELPAPTHAIGSRTASA